MASPFKAPLSTSAQEAEVRIVLAVVPLEVVSSFVPVKVTVAPLLIVGASFTLVTVMFEVAAAVLKAVVPPPAVVSTLVPWVPLVWSQAEKVTEAVVPFSPSGTNRSLSVERSKRAELPATAPTAFHVPPPSSEYCQAPVPLTRPVTAIPCTAPVSTSLTWPASSVETRSPPLAVWSSLIVVKLLAPDNSGASFTLLTVMFAVAVAVLKAVVPPLVVVSTLVPWVPLVWSQAEKVTEAVVPFSPSGTNRSLSVARSKRAELPATAPTAFHVPPPSSEYCQAPVLLTRPVTAIPDSAPESTSLTWPESSVETRSPPLAVWSSLIVVKLLAPDKSGASLTLVTVIEAVAVWLE